MKSVVDEIVVINIVTCTVYTYTSICSHTVTHVRTLAHTFTYMNTHTHTHTHASTCIHTHTCTHARARTQVHELMYLLMYTHTTHSCLKHYLHLCCCHTKLLLPAVAHLMIHPLHLVSNSLTVSTMIKREVDVLCVIPSVVQGLDGEHTIFFALNSETVPGASGYSTMPSERCASERDVFGMHMDLIIIIDSINVSACLSHFLIMKYCSHRDSRVF